VEWVLRWCEQAYALDWFALRYFNAAGADANGALGERHDPETHIIPLAIANALGNASDLQIYGTDYPTADGTAVRDYIHVTDLALAHVAALNHLFAGGRSEAINLGTGKGHSVRDVVGSVERVSGSAVTVREMPRQAGDPAILVADPGRAHKILGWSAGYTQLDSIVPTSLELAQAATGSGANQSCGSGERIPRGACVVNTTSSN
jgi:UDP-glucose 4-epimerase